MMRRLPAVDAAVKFSDNVDLIRVQFGGAHAAPDRDRGNFRPARHAAADGRHDGTQAIVFDETIPMTRTDQTIDDVIPIELTAGDELG